MSLFLSAFLLTACAAAPGNQVASDPTADSVSTTELEAPIPKSYASKTATGLAPVDISEVADIFFGKMSSLDARSEAVVEGRLNRWIVGDKITTDSGMRVGAAILAEVSVEKIVRGRADSKLAVGDVIYLPLVAGTFETEKVVDSLPDDLSTLLYLDHQLTEEELQPADKYRVEPGDPSAKGKPRWLTSPQGFVVTDRDDPQLQIWPLLGSAQRGALEDALPDGGLDGLSDTQRATIQK